MLPRLRWIALLFVGVVLGSASLILAKPDQKSLSPAASDVPSSKPFTPAVVCIGTVDIEGGLINIYPDSFPAPTKIVKVLAKEGATVKAGQPLLELDTVLAKLNVDEATAGLARAKSLLAQAEATKSGHGFAVAAQEAAVEAKDYEFQSKRIEAIELQKAVDKNISGAKNQLDAAAEGLKGLERSIRIEKEKLGLVRSAQPSAKIDEAKAGVELAKVKLEQAEFALKQLKCVSPVDGTIQRLTVTDGMLLGPQTRSAPFTLLPSGKLIVRAEVDQEFASRVVQNMPATIIDYSNASLTWRGKLSRIAEGFLPKRNNSNSIELLTASNEPGVLECIVAVESTGTHPLRFGQRVRITLGGE
jgi:multidrug resistance efflux pump